jgi:small subunit ribosomal protein S8
MFIFIFSYIKEILIFNDMLTRIRNANLVKARKVKIIRNNLICKILFILKKEGFIESFNESDEISQIRKDPLHKYIDVILKFKGINQKPYITKLKRISKPGLRVYVTHNNIPKILGGVGILILSTSKGLMTDRTARSSNIGGEVLFYIW